MGQPGSLTKGSRRFQRSTIGFGAWWLLALTAHAAPARPQGTGSAAPCPIPASNAVHLLTPSARPAPGSADALARGLVEALQPGAATSPADPFFLPRAPFLAIKEMAGADAYYRRLVSWYHEDVAALRERLHGERAEFVRFEPSRACVWTLPGVETNRLPYWSCYRSRLVVRARGREIALPVHVIISWGGQWYVTHLGEIRPPRVPRPRPGADSPAQR